MDMKEIMSKVHGISTLPFSGQRNASEGNGLCRTHADSYFLVMTCLGEGFYTMFPGHLLPVHGLLGLGVGDSDDKIHVALHVVLILMTSWYICTFFTFFTLKCFCIHQAWICTPLSIPGPMGLASSCILPSSLPLGIVVTCCLALITLFESL